MTKMPRAAARTGEDFSSTWHAFAAAGGGAALGRGPDAAVGFTPAMRHLPEAGAAVSAFARGPAAAASMNPGVGVLNVAAGINQRAIAAAVVDPIAAKQWHLGYLGDMATLWRDFDGTGVRFGVYDSGIDKRVSEFAGRYDARNEVVVGGVRYDGDYTPISGPHGTAVAGLIAAGRDGAGTIGVAYDATVTGVNIFDPYSGGGRQQGIFVNADDLTKFFAAVNQFDRFDVVNNSWGPSEPESRPDTNRLVEGSFAKGMVDAYVNATDTGRDGLGTIVVNAAGNYGMVRNSTDVLFAVDGAIDTAGTDRHAIAVAAYRQIDGSAASYSTRGAHLLISAPSGDYEELAGSGVWTADLKGKEGYNTKDDPSGRLDYTDGFGGTSAAAPIVSGVIGLMLDANAQLGWRDVKNILAASAVMPVEFDAGPTALDYEGTTYFLNEDRFRLTGSGSASLVNGGGYHFSTDYGYGAVDAFSAVRMAEVWSLFGEAKTSGNEASATASLVVDRLLPDARYDGPVTVTKPVSFTIDVARDIDIEHLDLRFSHTTAPNGFDDFDYPAAVRVTVTSPDQTAYTVSLTGLSYAYGEDDTIITEVLGFAGFRGENSAGRWTVTFEDVSQGDQTLLKGMTLDFSGSELGRDSVYHYTQEYATMAAIDGEAGRSVINDADGGTDWIDMSAIVDRIEIDLSGGDITLRSETTNRAPLLLSLANGTIENMVAGDGGDSLTGNALANTIYGMRGNDVISGLNGRDWLSGGQGNDQLDGGKGADTFFFSLEETTGRDQITRFAANDRLAFDGLLADADGDGKVELDVFTRFGVESMLRLDDVTFGDRISFDTRVKALYLVDEADGMFFYATRPSSTFAQPPAAALVPPTASDEPAAAPAMLWTNPGSDALLASHVHLV
jgi:subtilisin family serine protease